MVLRSADLLVLLLYSATVLLLGFWVSRGKKDAEDYFLAGKKLPAWAIGLSILGTCISSVTYIAYPGMAFARDWQYLIQGLTLPLLIAAGLLAVVPFYRRYIRMSVTEYVEKRFGPGVRAYTLVVIMIFELTRLATVMYLVSLVMNTITGYPIAYVILVTGVVTVVYTVAGGMEGIIWNDVIQTVLFFLGGLLAVWIAARNVDHGFAGIVNTAFSQGKFKLFDFTPDLSRATFYVLFLSGLVNFFYFLAGNQNQVQRYLCAPTEKAARNAALFGSLSSVVVWTLFMLVGTCLFVYFSQHPDATVAGYIAENKPDKVFPYFIATRLPAGVAGLVLAGLFAAAMSTLDASMATLSTLALTDIFQKYFKPSGRQGLLISQSLTLFWGVIGIALALLMIKVGAFLEFYFRLFSILGGSITGLFFLALLVRRVNKRGAMAGIIAGIVITVWGSLSYMGVDTGAKWLAFPWDPMMVGVIATVAVVVFGYGASRIFPSQSGATETPVLWDVFLKR
jgi:solute:Na+ symporter, SSS family